MKRLVIIIAFIFVSSSTILFNSTAYCEYTSYTDITLDSESAVGQTATLMLSYFGLFENYWTFTDSDMNPVYFKKDNKFKNQVKEMAKEGLKKSIKFKINQVNYFQNGSPIGEIIEIISDN